VGSRFRGARPDTYPLFSGLLDQYPGAAAAYSLRALTSGWLAGDVVEVRRSSDSTTQDFTASQILNGEMLDFVNNGTTDLYNSARYFNGTSATVVLGSNVAMAGDFSIDLSHLYVSTGSTQDIISDNTSNGRFGYSYGSSEYFLVTTAGVVFFTGSMPNENEVNVISINRIGTSVTLTLNGSDYAGTLGGTLNINRVSSYTGINYSKGFTYAINLNNQAAYTGLGTSVTAWEDTIGSNDGTEVNGAAYTGQPFGGFVSTWYDQSGNANDATQATTTDQPKIVDAGSLVGGLDFDGVDDWLDTSSIAASFSGTDKPLSAFSVAQSSSITGFQSIFSLAKGDSTTPLRYFGKQDASSLGYYAERDDLSILATSSGGDVSSKSLLTFISDGNSRTLFDDGTSVANDSINLGNITLTKSGIGAINRDPLSVSGFWDGMIEEVIVYNSDQSANRTGIETNIKAAYPALP